LDPSAELAANTQYTATLSSGITDAAGNALAPTSWSFTTAAAGGGGDTTPPTVTSTSPASGATGVAVGDNVTATFSEDVTGVSGTTFTLAPTAGGAAVGAAVAYDSTTRVATLDPDADLAANTQYTAALTSGITDAAGNALAPTSWSFTTAAATSSGPVVTNRSPAPGAHSIGVATNVTATFSTEVRNVDSSTFTLADVATGQSVAAVVTFNSTSLVATLDPDANLAPDTRYRATLTTGIRDSAGNTLAADDTWEFLTGPAPTPTGRYPGVNATGISRTANVSMVFSEPVQNVTTTTFTLTPADGGPAVVASVTRSSTTNKWILNPDQPLAGETRYTVTVSGGVGGVADLAGNPLATTITWSFTTAA
ncbi:Ig-like domain-containing protein, partial [Blastococcus deserti]